MAKSTLWLALRPRWSSWHKTPEGDPRLDGFDVDKVTKNPPKAPHGLVVKLVLVVPDRCFAPMRPTVEIEIPEHLVGEPRVEVELPDLGDD